MCNCLGLVFHCSALFSLPRPISHFTQAGRAKCLVHFHHLPSATRWSQITTVTAQKWSKNGAMAENRMVKISWPPFKWQIGINIDIILNPKKCSWNHALGFQLWYWQFPPFPPWKMMENDGKCTMKDHESRFCCHGLWFPLTFLAVPAGSPGGPRPVVAQIRTSIYGHGGGRGCEMLVCWWAH